MIGPVVHGPPVASRVMLVGQAPGPREGAFGRPFAWTAGRTMFRWFEEALGVDEATFRARVYIAAVARCFPGKASGGGDRRPDAQETERCRSWLVREVEILQPELVIAVGTMAIEQVLGEKGPLVELVKETRRVRWHGRDVDVARTCPLRGIRHEPAQPDASSMRRKIASDCARWDDAFPTH